MDDVVMRKRQQQVLHDKKWRKFLRKSRLFGYVPFVDFVLGAGSMALGTVRLDSDFDVIVAVRQGRMFTARFFAYVMFGILGWRRAKMNHDESASDKICFNHFVTPSSYRLSPPHQAYWQKLYQNLVPVFGPADLIASFFEANRDWMGMMGNYTDDLRHKYQNSSTFKNAVEFLLEGFFGNQTEKILRAIQINKIKRSLALDRLGYKPRIKYTDEELEFHPDTKRIENYELPV